MSNHKGFINILVILIVLAVAGAGSYYLVSRKNGRPAVSAPENNKNISEPNNQQLQNNAKTSMAAETADWKIYRNNQPPIFEVKYRPSWEVKSSWPETIMFCPSSCRQFYHGDVEIQNLSTYKYKSYEDFKVSCLKGLGIPIFNPGTINDENKHCSLKIKGSAEVQKAIKAGEQVYRDLIIAYSDTTSPVGITRYENGRISDKEFELMVSTFKLVPQQAHAKITAPSRGEKLTLGTKIEIVWNAPRANMPVGIFLANSSNASLSWKILDTSSSKVGENKISWIVGQGSPVNTLTPEKISAGSYLLEIGEKVGSEYHNAEYTDWALAVIEPGTTEVPNTVRTRDTFITVVSPNGPISYKKGDTINVKWDAGGIDASDKFFITVFVPQSKSMGRFQVSSQERAYDILIDPKVTFWYPGSNYRVKIEVERNSFPIAVDESDVSFSIIE